MKGAQMTTILSQQMGCTIKSDKYKTMEEFLKQLPGAEELAKEKALAERKKKEACAQKYYQAYKKQGEKGAFKVKSKKWNTSPVKPVVEVKKSIKDANKLETVENKGVNKERLAQIDSRRNEKALQMIASLDSMPLQACVSKNKVLKGVTLAHAAKELSHYRIQKIVINQKEYKVSNWNHALEKLLLKGILINAADRALRWKGLGLTDWYQLVEDVEVIGGVRRKNQKVYLKILSVIDVIEKLQWTFLMAGFLLTSVQVELGTGVACSSPGNVSKKKKKKMLRTPQGKTTTPIFSACKRDFGLKNVSSGYSLKNNSSNESGFRYIVENGVVVRIGTGHTASHTIARSSSDAEDTWIGMGHLARDNGRFGSIIGEDYAD